MVEDDEIQIHWSENIYDAALNDVARIVFSQKSSVSANHFMDLQAQFSGPESGVRYK